MRMIITNLDFKDEHIYVTGNTTIGDVKGEWCNKEPPILGKTYFFELNISEVDKSEVAVINNEQFFPSVNLLGNRVQFKGICEEIEDVYIIRFSNDWMEMISIDNDDFSIKRGDKILFLTSYDKIRIYPY